MTTGAVLDHRSTGAPRQVSRLAHVGPSWFASVMGTGIVATAAATLPARVPGLPTLALTAWVLATLLLAAVTIATVAHWATHPAAARGHLDHRVMSHFWGAPPMALMTVGAGAVLVGHELIGMRAAVAVDALLWTAGTAMGLWTMWSIPRRTLRRGDAYAGAAFGGWLMPVVPPMVSAASGAVLVPHASPGLRPLLVALCGGLFVTALVASAPLLVLVVARTLRGRLGTAATLPTLFIVLGPLGQSVTAAHSLGARAGGAWATASVAYGLPVLLLAAAWALVAATVVVRALRHGLPFALTWWSFTFPVGTVVTGTSGMADATGWAALDVTAALLLAVLLTAWAVVAARTVHGVWTGALLRAPQTA